MAASKIQPVILAGGGGTRLWPISREHFPKQFLALDGGRTLLQQTLLRLHAADAPAALPPLVVCNEEHRFFVLHQAQEAGVEPGAIVLEPAGRNTAPALTVAALLQQDADTVLAMMPADHRIGDSAAFAAAMARAAAIAAGGAIVVFGIEPLRPETGFGWLRAGSLLADGVARELEGFAEKPDAATAASYLEQGGYLWNSGIFVLRADTWLRAIRHCRPDIAAACEQAVAGGARDGRFLRLAEQAFRQCPAESVDYAVMERIAELPDVPGVVIPFGGGWSDVGSWSSLWEIVEADAGNNLLQGDVFAIDTRHSAIRSEHRLVAALGVEDLVIVETADAVLVTRRDRAQDVKRVVAELAAADRSERVSHRRVYRPWGSFETVDRGPRFQVKRITVMPGHSLSLQQHAHRAEHWVVVRGTATVVRGEDELLLGENESTYIPAGTKHRLSNRGDSPLEIIEVQSGSYLGEDDIVRFADDYNRK